MKSSKTPKTTLPYRGRPNRGAEGHGKGLSPARRHVSEEGEDQQDDARRHQGSSSEDDASIETISRGHPAPGNNMAQEGANIDKMRQRMSEALAHKQQQKKSPTLPSAESEEETETSEEAGENVDPVKMSSSSNLTSGTLSTDSAKTIRAAFDLTPGSVRTPSYPFPRMQLRLNRGFSHRSGPSHKPFTLLSPTNEPLLSMATVTQSGRDIESSDTSTPLGQASATSPAPQGDLEFPVPDLYDMVLMLGSEPGLDMWWANVTEILMEGFGAERASLAVPGDITDLENVPWGQKATFNIYGSDTGEASILDTSNPSEFDLQFSERRAEGARPSVDPMVPTSSSRPPLLSRHSIAGPLPETHSQRSLRPTAPPRAISSTAAQGEERRSRDTFQEAMRSVYSSNPPPVPESEASAARGPLDSSASVSSLPRCYVHQSIRPLEAEPDALLVRTGVAALFGKRKPILLTRAYTDNSSVENSSGDATKSDHKSQTTTSKARSVSSSTSNQSREQSRTFDEYEQPDPSPWVHSPSPSPAAQPDPDESPFFAQPASLDETAFEQNPPAHDYAATANQSLNAIGADMAKSLIHIPLIQPVPARGAVNSGLRFPFAILSFLSPLNPYPRNWRHSLTDLLPHLASSYSLAQQYSALQDRFKGGQSMRHRAAFGLGGTFSDEGSELELVAELSGQVALEKEKNRYQSSHSSPYSPERRSTLSKDSPGSSTYGTPLPEYLGFNTGQPLTPGRSGADLVDNYFSAKRSKSSQQPLTPGSRPFAEQSKQQAKKFNEKLSLNPKALSQRLPTGSSKSPVEPPTPTGARSVISNLESETGVSISPTRTERGEHTFRRQIQNRDSQSKDDGEKPLPELISSLMLNAVPLQLFLAKPSTGDLVWTNRKFDAFRSQGEGRVKDPWKNVHLDDRHGLVKLWDEALKSGSQFTHYIRVKRFNSDSDFRWFVFRASTLLSNNGRLLYWIGSFLDVHEQYLTNLEASEKEATIARDAKIRALSDAIPQVMFEAVEGEGIVFVNQQWHAYSGQNVDDARGFGFARQVHTEDLPKCGMLSQSYTPAISRLVPPTERSDSSSSSSSNKTAAPPLRRSLFAPDSSSLERMIREGSVTEEKDENGRLSYLTEIRLRSKGGEYRWFLVRLVKVDSPLLSPDRISWYGTCTDIETRKVLERELNTANKKVNSEMESKTKFFANMSHEIRTPLNGILGSMPWLMEWSLDHDQRRTVDTIQNSANNLRELVDNILDVTKVEAGKMSLLPKWFNVRALLEEVVDTVSSRAIERGLELNYSIDATIPTTVKADPFRLRQVLLNLLGNAVKFTEQGEVYVHCHVRKSPDDASLGSEFALLAFNVVDTGRGFVEEDFQRLFKQFGQVGGSSSHDAGTGLGLFLSKQLVEMHGGELSVESRPGEGSKFSFFVKVEVSTSETQTPTNTLPERQHAPRHSSSFTSGSLPRSEFKMPANVLSKSVSSSQGILPAPGLSRFAGSPGALSPSVVSSAISPPIVSSEGSAASMRSNSGNIMIASSMSSLYPSPEPLPSHDAIANPSERQLLAEKNLTNLAPIRRTESDTGPNVLLPDKAHPATYSIVVICPAEYARTAIKQHIEHVVPHQIPVNVTAIPDIGSFLELTQNTASPIFTHIVLDLPASSDIMLFMRQMVNSDASTAPALIVITDHYQKRDILEDFTLLTLSGRRAFLINKPVKPSVFATIFDPAQSRSLSKENQTSNRSTGSRSIDSKTNDFHSLAMKVKSRIASKGYRVLLVEDSEVNRMVIMRYLRKVNVQYETANDGEEATDLVFAKSYGYYSLIICDIQMPKKNGYQVCREVRTWEGQQQKMINLEQPSTDSSGTTDQSSTNPATIPGSTQKRRSIQIKQLPIMALTANAMPEERVAAAEAGFTDYLTKPVDFSVLGNMMINLLDPDTPHVFLRDRPLDS